MTARDPVDVIRNLIEEGAPDVLEKIELALGYPKLAYGHREDFYLLANARLICNRELQRQPNWVLAMRLFATGSTSARQICVDAGIDPDAKTVQRIQPAKEPAPC